MQFLEWLDKHFASNSHYYYADDLVCPFDLIPEQQSESRPQAEPTPRQSDASDAAAWQ